MRILTTGELLWDIFGESEFLGGAPLNFSVTSQRLGSSVALLSAVGADARGIRALESMKALGLTTDFVQSVSDSQTGTARVTTDAGGHASYLIERPAAFDCLVVDDAVLSRLRNLHPEWIYFGTLAQTNPSNEEMLHRLVRSMSGVKCFYDLNLRDGHWNLPLVERLSGMASVLKLNESEAQTLFQLTRGFEQFSLEGFCRYWSSIYGGKVICVTLGDQGCAIFTDDALQTFEGFSVQVVDTVGAGDSFAAAFLHGHDLGWSAERTASFANALGALVASRAGATPDWTTDECLRLIEANRTNINKA